MSDALQERVKAQIGRAQKKIEEIDFTHWPNQEVKSAAMLVLESLAFDYSDERRNLILAEAIGLLQTQLLKGLAEQQKKMQSTASCVVYKLTGTAELPSEIEQPLHSI